MLKNLRNQLALIRASSVSLPTKLTKNYTLRPRDDFFLKLDSALIQLFIAKIARILRFLAVHHIFKEVAPDVFARNRCSSSLDTGKSVQELKT